VIPIPPPPVVAQQPPPVQAAPAPAPEPTKVATAEPAGDPADQARMLWRKAIDAERNQDYVEAVSCYEQIKKLPADVQPWGLDVHLEQARKLVK